MSKNKLVGFKGLNGILEVYEDRIVISRKTAMGFFFQGNKGNREIYFSDIKAIEFKKPTIYSNGYLQFITNAESTQNQKVGIMGTKLEASKDPNAIIVRAFNKKTVEKSVEAYDKATEILNKYKGTTQTTHTPPLSNADEIKKYKALLDDGVITQEEFDNKKQQLLNI